MMSRDLQEKLRQEERTIERRLARAKGGHEATLGRSRALDAKRALRAFGPHASPQRRRARSDPPDGRRPGPGPAHRRGAPAARALPAVPRVRSRAQPRLQRAVRRANARRHRDASQRPRVPRRAGCSSDPRPDDGGGLLPAVQLLLRIVPAAHPRGSKEHSDRRARCERPLERRDPRVPRHQMPPVEERPQPRLVPHPRRDLLHRGLVGAVVREEDVALHDRGCPQ